MAHFKTRIAVLVFAASISCVWTRFLSGGLGSITAWIVLLTVVPLVGVIVAVVCFVQLARRRAGRAVVYPLALCALGLWPAAWNVGLFTIAYPFRLATTTPSATVRLPLDGPVRVVWGGDDVRHNRHASTPDQRWAYDLVVEPAMMGSPRLEDYGCYGREVVAPVSAEVWRSHDGEPEQVPGRLLPNYKAPLGNHVVLRLSDGTFLLLAHLKTGSVVAHEGERIAEGTTIGRCGNSGNTSEPHVHIHHQRQDPKLYPVNFAEGLPLYFRDTDGAAMPRGGIVMERGKARLVGDVVRGKGPSLAR